ncbi:MAG: SRPBCC family protein [Gemmatimonadaceae bacterium]|nr:SRPBCC family protein [Gemmatimonadaceae bacterium]
MTARTAIQLGPMPLGRPMETIDEIDVRAPIEVIYRLARDVERWPDHLPHYRYVKFRESDGAHGGIVEMSANRPFGSARSLRVDWPTWWLSEMSVNDAKPSIRFRHIGGITKGMDVEWTFVATGNGTHVRIVHVWEGPRVPILGIPAATLVIGPVFVHGIASRTLAGLAAAAERESNELLAGNHG